MDWRILTAITVVTWGGYSVLLKKAAGEVPWRLSMLIFVASYSAVIGVFCLLGERVSFAELSFRKVMLPVLGGLLCGIGGVTFFKAIPAAPGSIFLPLVSLSMIISGVLCAVFLKEPVSLRMIVGVLCAAVAVVLLAK